MKNDLDVTVLMAVYNGEKYLKNAIDSILNQTYNNFEFLIINDGSNDNTKKILDSYDDKRIRIIHNRKNQGLTKCLHDGVVKSKGKYIARLDADDIALPDRLLIQKEYLDNNDNVLVVHSMFHYINDNGDIIYKNLGNNESNIFIKWNLLYKNRLQHSTVMFKKLIYTKYKLNYNVSYKRSQDYELWSQISHVGDFKFIPVPLILFRLHDKSITTNVTGEEHLNANLNIIIDNFKRYGIKIDKDFAGELSVLNWQLAVSPFGYNYKYIVDRLHNIIDDIENKFIEKFNINPNELYPIQAKQYCKWAFFIFPTAKKYSFLLLEKSFKKKKCIIFNLFFLSTLFSFILGKRFLYLLYNCSQSFPKYSNYIMRLFKAK